MATGKIVQIIGAVIDVEFPQDAVPKVYDALNVETGLTLEVQQQLGGGVVRCIALGASDGLKRGLKVTDLLKKVRLVKKNVGLFSVLHQVMKNSPTAPNY